MNVDELRESVYHFHFVDYVVVLLMIAGCVMVGLYFAFKLNRDKEIPGDDAKNGESVYLVGGRNMKVFPISMSLISSFASGIAILGTPTEIYLYGIQFLYLFCSLIIMGFILPHFFLRVFHDLKLISINQYLDIRFNRHVRKFGSFMFLLTMILSLPIVIYVPALAINQVTGISVHLATPLFSLVCIFYTCVGGLKAVVITDVAQTLLMIGAMIVIAVKGTIDIGGPGIVLQKGLESGRIEAPSFKPDITERYTFYSIFIAFVAQWLVQTAICQNMMQRYLSLPTLSDARNAMWIFIGGLWVFYGVCSYCGLLIYAAYSDCDPLQTKLAKHNDQLVPLFVMQAVGEYPGLPGVFVVGVLSAALSSFASGLHSISTVILQDFVKPAMKNPLTERQTFYVMRGVVLTFGVGCFGLVFVVEKLGEVLKLNIMLSSVVNGPLLGVFTAGLMVPWIEGTGALIGGVSSLIIMSWIGLRAQVDLDSGIIVHPQKPLTTHGCNYTFTDFTPMNMFADNMTSIADTMEADKPFRIYNMSYLYYATVGSLLTIIIALIVSFLVGPNKLEEVNSSLFSPPLRRWIDRKRNSTIVTEQEKRHLNDSSQLRYPSVSYHGLAGSPPVFEERLQVERSN